MDRIESRKNPYFKIWKSLLEGRGIKKQAQFLLMGRKLVPEFLSQKPELFTTLLLSPENRGVHLSTPLQLLRQELTSELFQELDIFQTKFPILIGNIPKIPDVDLSKPASGLEILTGLGDPSNQGALIRSCEAFDASKIILLKESTHPFHPKSLRASSGSTLRAPLFLGPSISEITGDIISLNMTGTPIDSVQWKRDCRLLMGEEGPGLPAELRSQSISIPISEQTESLNAVAATSIALFSYRQSHPLK